MIHDNNAVCPKCGGELKYYDSVERIVRTDFGKRYWIKIERMICTDCHSTHRVIPNILMPYKHYEKEIIKGFVDRSKSSYDLRYEDYPSESVVNEWRRTQNKQTLL